MNRLASFTLITLRTIAGSKTVSADENMGNGPSFRDELPAGF